MTDRQTDREGGGGWGTDGATDAYKDLHGRKWRGLGE